MSGDTIRSAEVERLAEGVDLLIHEALAPHMVAILRDAAREAGLARRARILDDILDYHASPVDAARSAAQAGVGHLLLYHIVPPLLVPGAQAAFLEGVADAYSGEVTLGRDGTRVSLPADSGTIRVAGD